MVTQTGPVEPMRYLTLDRARYFRAIMRHFYSQHEQHRYQVTPDEICTQIQTWDSRYTLDQAMDDLDYLEKHGNLLGDYSSVGLNTIAAFKTKRKIYQATNLGIEIERFLRTLEARTGRAGALNVSALESLWDHLTALEERLARPGEARLGQAWTELFTVFQQFHQAANDYFGEMEAANRQRLFNHEAFLIFRDSLVRYLDEFAKALYLYGPRFRDRLARWEQEGKVSQLAAAIARAEQRAPHLEAELQEPAQPEVVFIQQWQGFTSWFAPGGSVETVRHIAMNAISLVVRQAKQLSERSHAAAARTRELADLARRFAALSEIDQSQRLASLVFGCEMGRQWLGDGGLLAGEQVTRDPWQDEPIPYELYPITRGSGERRVRDVATIPDRSAEKQERMAEKLRERQEQSARLAAMFGPDGFLDLSTASFTTSAEWELFINLLRECLTSTDHRATALDGSIIILENTRAASNRDRPARVQSPHGIFLCPNFRLRRQVRREVAVR